MITKNNRSSISRHRSFPGYVPVQDDHSRGSVAQQMLGTRPARSEVTVGGREDQLEDPVDQIHITRQSQFDKLHHGDLFPLPRLEHDPLSHLKPGIVGKWKILLKIF
jgi:hypothetical protein